MKYHVKIIEIAKLLKSQGYSLAKSGDFCAPLHVNVCKIPVFVEPEKLSWSSF